MKKLFIAIALVMVFGSLCYGQTKMNAEQAVMNLEQEMTDALVKSNMPGFNKYVADNVSFTDPSGLTMNKAQFTSQFKTGDLKLESSKIDDMKVQLFGDTAVVTYKTTDKGMYKGRGINGQYHWTDVFAKTGGKWMLIASQGTPITPQ